MGKVKIIPLTVGIILYICAFAGIPVTLGFSALAFCVPAKNFILKAFEDCE